MTSSGSDKRSKTTDVSVAPDLEVNCSLTSVLSNPDLEAPCSTEGPRLEHRPARCSETRSSEVVPEPELNRSLLYRLPKPVRGTLYNRSIPPGFEKIWLRKRETTNVGIVSQPEVSVNMIPQPPTPVLQSGSPPGPRLEELASSSCSETTNSEVVSESEVIRRTMPLARIAGSVYRTPVPPPGKEGAPDLQQTEISCSYTDTQDSDVLSDSDRPSFHSEMSTTVAVTEATSSKSSCDEVAVDVEQSDISLGFSDTVAAGVLSVPAKRSFHCEAKDNPSVAAKSSTGALVVEEPMLTKKVAKGFGKLNPNAKEFVPGASKFAGYALARAKEDWNLQQRLKLNAEQLTLGWMKKKSYSPFSVPSPSLLDLGTALKLNYEKISKWTRWIRGNDSGLTSNADLVWGPGFTTANTRTPGRAQEVKLPSGNKLTTPPLRRKARRQSHSEAKGNASVAANSSTAVLVKKFAKSSKGVACGKLDPTAKEFVLDASKSGDPLVRAKDDTDLQQKLKLNAEQLTLGWIEGKSNSPFSVPSHSPLDLGTALKLNYEAMAKRTWTRGHDLGQSFKAEVVWGSPGLKTSSTAIPGCPRDLKLPSGSKLATPPQRRNDRRQSHRPFYHPCTLVSPVPKARHVKA